MDYKALKAHYTSEYAVVDNPTSGTVYTPEVLAYDMLYLALRARLVCVDEPILSDSEWFSCFDAFRAGRAVEASLATRVIDVLLNWRVLDPACGSGMLLLAYAELLTFLAAAASYDENQIFAYIETYLIGIDIDSAAIQVASQLFLSFSDGKASARFFCFDSLIEPFTEPIDLIISNPPYIGEKGHLAIFEAVKATEFGQTFYEGKMDYFYFFIYKAYDWLSSDGTACFLTSNYFFTADGAKKLRHFFKTDFFITQMLDYEGENAFGTRGLHACLYTLSKLRPEFVEKTDRSFRVTPLPYGSIFDTDDQLRFIVEADIRERLSQMEARSCGKLGDYYNVFQGLISGADRSESGGIFVYTNEEAEQLPEPVKPFMKPLYKNSAIRHYYHRSETRYQILYPESFEADADAKAVMDLLAPHRERLIKRREVRKGYRPWYALTWPRKRAIFENEKIIVPQRAAENYFAYSDKPFYASADVYFIGVKEQEMPLNLKALTLILNSAFYALWLKYMGKKKGAAMELYATPLKRLPLPILSDGAVLKLEALGEAVFGEKLLCEPDMQSIQESVEEILSEAFKLKL
jgi:adenine-specific DNA-methyltransferase